MDTLNIKELGVKVIARYELSAKVPVKVGQWYDVAVGPYNKRAKTVHYLPMKAVESSRKQGVFILMQSEVLPGVLGGSFQFVRLMSYARLGNNLPKPAYYWV